MWGRSECGTTSTSRKRRLRTVDHGYGGGSVQTQDEARDVCHSRVERRTSESPHVGTNRAEVFPTGHRGHGMCPLRKRGAPRPRTTPKVQPSCPNRSARARRSGRRGGLLLYHETCLWVRLKSCSQNTPTRHQRPSARLARQRPLRGVPIRFTRRPRRSCSDAGRSLASHHLFFCRGSHLRRLSRVG